MAEGNGMVERLFGYRERGGLLELLIGATFGAGLWWHLAQSHAPWWVWMCATACILFNRASAIEYVRRKERVQGEKTL